MPFTPEQHHYLESPQFPVDAQKASRALKDAAIAAGVPELAIVHGALQGAAGLAIGEGLDFKDFIHRAADVFDQVERHFRQESQQKGRS